MATAEGTWSSIIVMVNFFFGILVFHEGVKSFAETCVSFVLLSFGLVGMSLYSTPNVKNVKNVNNVNNVKQSSSKALRKTETGKERQSLSSGGQGGADDDEFESDRRSRYRKASTHSDDSDVEAAIDNTNNIDDGAGEKGPKDNIILFGSIILSKREVGITAAAINGLCGGTSLVPMHYAAEEGFSGKSAFQVHWFCSCNCKIESNGCHQSQISTCYCSCTGARTLNMFKCNL